MLTGSKFGIISALFALIVLFVLAAATKSLKHARFRRLIILAVILLPLLIVFRGPVTSRIAEAESGGSQVHSTTFRIYTWRSTLGMIRSHPWVGVGPGAFKTVYPSYSLAGPTKHAHNSYLQIGAETGLPALIAFVVALGAVCWSGLVGILSRRTAPPASQTQPEDEPPPREIWKDLVPFSGWPMMNCAIFAALAGSAVTNLVDSNWYVIGIAFPFWVMAGVLAAQSGALRSSFRIGWTAQGVLVGICVVLIAINLSLGLGDLFAPNQFETEASASTMVSGYRLASAVCPVAPHYHRELAKWLASEGDTRDAEREIDKAARLAPYDFTNYYLKGMIAFQRNDLRTATRSLEHAIKLNPNATRALMQLALVRRAHGDTKGFEAALLRIIQIEESDYERISGVPEYVDTSYAYAHAYFGGKYLALGSYSRSAGEFLAGIRRLEKWVSQDEMREMRRSIGLLTPHEESEILTLLRASYLGLANAYEGLGKRDKAGEAAKKAAEVPNSLE
jgi:tetratricopeptide (TPR) repeat protein